MADGRNWWVLAWALAGGWMLYLLSPILTPFVVAALLAYLGDPLVDRLEERRMPRSLAVAMVFFVLFGGMTLGLVLIVPQLEGQISRLLALLPGYLNWVQENVLPGLLSHLPYAEGGIDLRVLQQTLAQNWSKAGGLVAGLWSSISASGMAVIAWLANLVLIPVLTFYLLRDWDHLVAGAHDLLPRRSAPVWARLARDSDEVLGAFLRGQLLVMFALGVIYTTGLWLTGLDLALLIGMFAGIVSFVPYLGLIVGILSAGIASFFQFQGIGELHWVVLVFVAGQLLEGTVLTPRLVGERIGLHPVAVIFAVMAGAQLYGFFGILLALPVAAVAVVLLRHALGRYRASPFYGPDAQAVDRPPGDDSGASS